jgi:hypothetical protein
VAMIYTESKYKHNRSPRRTTSASHRCRQCRAPPSLDERRCCPRSDKEMSKTKTKNSKKTSPRPPPRLFWVTLLLARWLRAACSSVSELAQLEATRPEQLASRRSVSCHAGSSVPRMQTKPHARAHNSRKTSSHSLATTLSDRR